MSKLKDAALYTVWGVVILSFIETFSPSFLGIGKMLAHILYKTLPGPVFERLEGTWRGGDWIILLTGAVWGAIFGFAVWLVDSRMGARFFFGKSKNA